MPDRSPLHDDHARLGARFVEFAGWDMPVQYEGVIAEHMAVREHVGVFDVSHLGRFAMAGAGATDVLRRLLCNDVADIDPGRAQYTMMLTPAGGVVDDIIVWRFGDDDYWVMPNGVNHDRVLAAFREEAPGGVRIESTRESTALLAVQGPGAAAVADQVFGEMPKRFRVGWLGADGAIAAAGTGYTGERGWEMAVPLEMASGVLDAVVAAGATPCGLGCRDTLRLEMGYPLWGQDLDEDTSPLEAGLDWVVDFDHDFVGKEPLQVQAETGVDKTLVAFVMEGRAVPRTGYPLAVGDSVGTVTSGNFSPVLQRSIGMGFVAPPPDESSEAVTVEIRNRAEGATRTSLPFIDKS